MSGSSLHYAAGDEDDDDFDLDILNDGENDTEGGGSKECTGRWTREEHQLFIKGLELYGKGWKKIACLIKTRTVVQIRTHAQKYFLKLSKARQNGELAAGFGIDGRPFGGLRRRKKRKGDRPVSLSTAVLPFVKDPESKDPADVDESIYSFLSPSILPPEPPGSKTPGRAAHSSNSSSAAVEDAKDDSNGGEIVTKADFRRIKPPKWYVKNQDLETLLREAEGLDWTADSALQQQHQLQQLQQQQQQMNVQQQQPVSAGAKRGAVVEERVKRSSSKSQRQLQQQQQTTSMLNSYSELPASKSRRLELSDGS